MALDECEDAWGTTPLEEHVRSGKRFATPLRHLVETDKDQVSWRTHGLPELIWLALLIRRTDLQTGIRLGEVLADFARERSGQREHLPLLFVSDFALAPEDVVREALAAVPEELLAAVTTAVTPLLRLYSDCPMSTYFRCDAGASSRSECVTEMHDTVLQTLDRTSRLAAEVQTLAVYTMGVAGKLVVCEGVELGDLNHIAEYPDTDESRSLAATMRACLTALLGLREADAEWPERFWRQGRQITPCCAHVRPTVHKSELELGRELLRAGMWFVIRLRNELSINWSLDDQFVDSPLQAAVIGGLLSRQAALCTDIVTAPVLWRQTAGAIVLRAMTETHITLAWLLANGQPHHFDSFVEHGLGQEKLFLLHAYAHPNWEDLLTDGPLAARRRFLESQRYASLIEINVGSWLPGSNIRTMADEAGCGDLYKLYFAPLSQEVHGSWSAVSRLNLQVCSNPLHGLHFVPTFDCSLPDYGIPLTAADLLGLTYKFWAGEPAQGDRVLGAIDTYVCHVRDTLSEAAGHADE